MTPHHNIEDLISKAGEITRNHERGTEEWTIGRIAKVTLNKEKHDYACDFCGTPLNGENLEENPLCPMCARCPDCGHQFGYVNEREKHSCDTSLSLTP